MSEDQAPAIPPSFQAVHLGARGRSLLSAPALRERYELCEDLAQSLVERVRALQRTLGVDEASVLERVARGLATPESGLAEGEADWVRRRLAELLASAW